MGLDFFDREVECTAVASWPVAMIVTLMIPKRRTVGHSLKEVVV